MGLHDAVVNMLSRWSSSVQEFPHDPSRFTHNEVDEMLSNSLKNLEATTISLQAFVENERRREEEEHGK